MFGNYPRPKNAIFPEGKPIWICLDIYDTIIVEFFQAGVTERRAPGFVAES